MRTIGLHHVGVIVPDQEQLVWLMNLLGLEQVKSQYVPEYEADCVFAGGTQPRIEFIVPRGGKLANFNKGAGGLHHIAISVESIDEAQRWFAEQDVQLLESAPVSAGSMKINFIPPAFTRGIVVEVVEDGGRDSTGPKALPLAPQLDADGDHSPDVRE